MSSPKRAREITEVMKKDPVSCGAFALAYRRDHHSGQNDMQSQTSHCKERLFGPIAAKASAQIGES